MRIDPVDDALDHSPERLPPLASNVVIEFPYHRIEKRGGCSQQPLPLNLGYVRASREVDAAVREVNKFLDVVSRRLGRRF